MSTAWSNIQVTDLLHIRQICSVKERKKERRRNGKKGELQLLRNAGNRRMLRNPGDAPYLSEVLRGCVFVYGCVCVSVCFLKRDTCALKDESGELCKKAIRREPRITCLCHHTRVSEKRTPSTNLLMAPPSPTADWFRVVSARLIDTSPSEVNR